MNSIFKYHLFLHNSNNSSVSSVGIGFKHQKCEPVCHPWRQFGFLGVVIQRISRSAQFNQRRRSRCQRKLFILKKKFEQIITINNSNLS